MKPKLCDECELRVGDKFILKEDVLKLIEKYNKNITPEVRNFRVWLINEICKQSKPKSSW